MKKNVALAALLAAVSFHAVAEEKRPKLTWKQVELVETEPKGCTLVEKLDVDSGTWMTFSGKGFKKKAERKLKKQAGKAGANVVFITKELMVGAVMNREANAYYCPQKEAK